MAASIGAAPASEASQSARLLVRHSACRTGTSSRASAVASQPSASLALDPPLASTVTTSASTSVSSSSTDGQAAVAVGPQRADVDRAGVGALGLERVAEHVDEGGVARQLVRPVEDDADRRPGRVDRPVSRAAPYAGSAAGAAEADAGEQHGVGQERHELARLSVPPSRR